VNRTEWVRDLTFPGKILLIDGMTGTGKNMVSRVIDGYSCNHNPIFSYELEQLCVGWVQNKIEADAALALIKMHVDKLRYNFSISRELNFRPSDLTSVLKSIKKFTYIQNVFKNDGESATQDIEFLGKNLCLITHQLLYASTIINEAFPNKVLNIFTIRNPVYLYQHWLNYIPLHGNSPRDITVWNNYKGNAIPWFVQEYGDLYINADYPGKTAIVLSKMINKSIEYIESQEANKNFLAINFENFVLKPQIYLDRINTLLGENFSKKNTKILKRENIPRKHINDGKKLAIYARNGSETLGLEKTQEQDYKEKLSDIIANLDNITKSMFLESIEKYNKKFGIWF
jgi:hypothetical protein